MTDRAKSAPAHRRPEGNMVEPRHQQFDPTGRRPEVPAKAGPKRPPRQAPEHQQDGAGRRRDGATCRAPPIASR